MKIFKTLDTLLAGLGNIKAMRRTHIDTYTENKINHISGEKIAISDNGGIWIEYQELAAFIFMNITILSTINIKTFKGCTLTFLGEDIELILNSDTTDIESDFSNISNRWMAKISFIVTNENIKFIDKRDYKRVHLRFKKTTIEFNSSQ